MRYPKQYSKPLRLLFSVWCGAAVLFVCRCPVLTAHSACNAFSPSFHRCSRPTNDEPSVPESFVVSKRPGRRGCRTSRSVVVEKFEITFTGASSVPLHPKVVLPVTMSCCSCSCVPSVHIAGSELPRLFSGLISFSDHARRKVQHAPHDHGGAQANI